MYCNKCETEECKQFVDIVNNKIDPSADPCEDFDAYACGGWKSNSEIPSTSGSLTQFGVVSKALTETLKKQLGQGWKLFARIF